MFFLPAMAVLFFLLGGAIAASRAKRRGAETGVALATGVAVGLATAVVGFFAAWIGGLVLWGASL